MSEQFHETTESLMRPDQVEQAKGEIGRLESTLNAPPHVQMAIQDVGEMRRQLKSLKRDLDTQAPKPYVENLDLAIARSAHLKGEILQGMPTQAEMRRNPAGAVDKHRKWEKRNKHNILEWKNIQLNLHSGGHLDELEDAKDVANFEKYRPDDASHELNMHNEQISGAVQYGPTPGSAPVVVFSTDETSALKEIDPEIAGSLALMTNEQRASVKAFMQNMDAPVKVNGWSPERRAKASAAAKERYAAKQKEG